MDLFSAIFAAKRFMPVSHWQLICFDTRTTIEFSVHTAAIKCCPNLYVDTLKFATRATNHSDGILCNSNIYVTSNRKFLFLAPSVVRSFQAQLSFVSMRRFTRTRMEQSQSLRTHVQNVAKDFLEVAVTLMSTLRYVKAFRRRRGASTDILALSATESS